MANLNFENIQIEPAVLTWGQQHLTKFTLKQVIAGRHFLISSTTDDYYVWLDDGVASDPAVPGRTGIAVAYTSGQTPFQVLQAMATQLVAAGFNAKAYLKDEAIIYIQNKKMGAVTPSAIGSFLAAEAVISNERAGFILDIGLTEDFELGLQTSLVDVTASQFGATVLERLRNGMNIESISVNMKEVVVSKMKAIMEPHYPEFTPTGGTPVQGIGNSKDFSNVSRDSGKLVIHPMRLPESDRTEDFAFWRACPLLTGLNFSGESEQMMTVEFSILPDWLLDRAVAHGVFGDHEQNFLA
ncbi:MAG: hypothetical protein QXT45_04330 [Candidatus Bilamarchaeaceae archaeon]